MSGGSQRLRVLVVSLGRRGGVTQYGRLMARALCGECDVAVISSSAAENREQWREVDAPHLEVDTFDGLVGMVLSYLRIPTFARIRRFAAQFAPDVVYYPGGHAWKPVLDLLVPGHPKIVLTVHDPELHSGENSLLHRLFDAANRLRVDGYVLLNRPMRDAFVERLKLDPATVTIIEHGVFDDLLEAARPLGAVDGLEAAVPLAGRYALFVGRIQHYKGVEVLLEAYASLPQHEAPPLVIAGSGEFSARERELIDSLAGRDVVVVNHWLSQTEIASLVASARFVVLPYRSGTQSGVIPLASAFGVPAIASAVGGVADQVLDAQTGFLCPPGDASSLAARLSTAFSLDEQAYARMSEAAAEHARTEWAWDRAAARLVAFFRSIDA